MVKKVEGWKPRLSKGPITPAVDGQWVLPTFVETKPAVKAEPTSAGDSKKEKPKEKVLSVVCPDCLQKTLYVTAKGAWCTQCSKK